MKSMASVFRCLSLSYKKAPVEIRELLSLSNEQSHILTEQIKDYTSVTELLIISTCNRTEFYYTALEDLSLSILKLIGALKAISSIENYLQYFEISQEMEAIYHLYSVSMGLESKVVGDIQISNQVKNAYQLSADKEMAGPFLHRVMHSIFFTNKRVSQETAFRDGAASVSYATVELAEELTSNIISPRVLILGLGEMGADVCRNLVHSNIKEVFIANRTESKAIELAEECGFVAVKFEDLWQHIASCDVIISGVSASSPLITNEKVKAIGDFAFKYFIDMSVPRSIEKTLEDIPGVLLYNIDQIQSKTSAALQKRKDAVPQVEQIISESIGEFSEWQKEMEVSPTINKLKGALEEIRQDELQKYVKKLTEKESEALEKITKSMMQKIIKLPVLQLKAACKRGEAETLIDVLNNLFDLDNQTVKKE